MIGKLSTHLFIALVAVFAQRSHETSCPYPVPPKHAVLSARSYLDEFNFNGFQAYQRVDFICRVGYRQTKGGMWSICGVSGRWYPDTRQAGECTRELRTGETECKGRFRCRKDLQCIDRKLRCDCKPDCRDGTDEIDCKNPRKTMFIRPVGRKNSGVLTSPNYPLGYARNDFRCHFIFYTDPAYRIKVSFEDFSLREKSKGRCLDYVKLSGVSAVYRRKFENDVRVDSKTDRTSGIVSCGGKNFGVVVSNSSQLEMFVRLTGVKAPARTKEMKGYSLSWSVISQSRAAEIVGKVNKSLAPRKTKSIVEPTKPKGKSTSENLFTILLPVTISALLPVSMLLFLCYHIRAKQINAAREDQAKKARQDELALSGRLNEGDVNIMGTAEDGIQPLMLLKEEVVSGSDFHGPDVRETVLYRSSEGTKSEANEKLKALYSPPVKELDSFLMTVDLNVNDKCGRFSKRLVPNDRQSKHVSTSKTTEYDSKGVEFDRWTNGGMQARSCNWNTSNDRRKYLEKSSRPQSKVIEEDTARTANRKLRVCSCNDCENTRLKIEGFLPLTCEFDTVQEICTELERSNAQNLPGDCDCEREVVGRDSSGYENANYGRHRVHREGRVRHGKRRRKHGRRSRTVDKCPASLGLNGHGRDSLLPERDNFYQQSCSVCANAVQVLGTHRASVEYDRRLETPVIGSNISNSSDSGTCTGSEAPAKWQPQDSLRSSHNRLRHRSDTDSMSKESAYAESFDDCANFCSCQRGFTRRELRNGRHSYSGFAPPQCYCRNQDGRSTMADRLVSIGDRFDCFEMGLPEKRDDLEYESSITNQEYCNYIEPYPETDEPIVYEETESNFSKLPIDNGHLCREQFFQNGRRSKECLVYTDNVLNMPMPDSMPSYEAVCECEACIYSRVNEPFISRNRPLGGIASASAVLP